jgi:hypothetical protein
MSRAERDEFLSEPHIGVLAVDEPGRGPTALPIWYMYLDGDVLILTEGDSLKARLLRAAGRATMTVQSEAPPYKYLSVEGPVDIEPAVSDSLEMATRYLGAELGRWYADSNPLTPQSSVVRLRPEHWRSMDFAKLLGL